MMTNTVELMDRGMRCLVEKLGTLDAEKFIAIMKKEKFDYTEWQRDYFDRMSPEQISKAATKYAEDHPFTGKAIRL